MDIGYLWDEIKYERVRRVHRVSFWEVVDVFDGENTLYVNDPAGHWGRWMAVGATRAGRVLQVVCGDDDAPLVRIITAFDATREWRDEYER